MYLTLLVQKSMFDLRLSRAFQVHSKAKKSFHIRTKMLQITGMTCEQLCDYVLEKVCGISTEVLEYREKHGDL